MAFIIICGSGVSSFGGEKETELASNSDKGQKQNSIKGPRKKEETEMAGHSD